MVSSDAANHLCKQISSLSARMLFLLLLFAVDNIPRFPSVTENDAQSTAFFHMPEVCIKSPNNRRYSLFVCFLIPDKGFSTPDPTAATGLEFRKVVPGVLNTFSSFETAGVPQHNAHSENEACNGVYVYPVWKPNS